jgi:hypothetical protein
MWKLKRDWFGIAGAEALPAVKSSIGFHEPQQIFFFFG